jgi:hypothetical protein
LDLKTRSVPCGNTPARRFNVDGDIQPNYSKEEKTEAIRSTMAHLTALAIAWCQIASRDNTADNPAAKAIGDFYSDKYGPPAHTVQIEEAAHGRLG